MGGQMRRLNLRMVTHTDMLALVRRYQNFRCSGEMRRYREECQKRRRIARAKWTLMHEGVGSEQD